MAYAAKCTQVEIYNSSFSLTSSGIEGWKGSMEELLQCQSNFDFSLNDKNTSIWEHNLIKINRLEGDMFALNLYGLVKLVKFVNKTNFNSLKLHQALETAHLLYPFKITCGSNERV